MLALSARRVEDQTDPAIRQHHQRMIAANVEYYARHKGQIPRRLAELDQEWDIERVLETGSSTLSLLGMFMGITSSRKWFLVTIAVQGFFLQHALQGWCPPLPVLRNLGVRTPGEIDQERAALKALRGDYDHLPASPDTAAEQPNSAPKANAGSKPNPGQRGGPGARHSRANT